MDRWRFYTVYGHWIWAVFFVASILAAIVLLFGCGGAEKTVDTVRAEACWERINAAIQAGRSCQEAVAGVAEVMRAEPNCEVATRAITIVCHDGGTDDGPG